MWRLTTILSIFILCGSAVFIWWIDRPTVRYAFVAGGWDCSVHQFVNLPTANVDLVAIGSSRVRAGLDLKIVADHSGGKIKSYYNFSRTGINPIRNYVIFRDLIEKDLDLKYAYVEINTEAFLAREIDNIGIQRDVGMLRFSDLLHLYYAYPSSTVVQRIHTVAASALKKLGDSIVYVASGRIAQANASTENVAPLVCWRPYYDKKSKRKALAIAKTKEENQSRFGDIWTVEYDVVQSFTTPAAEIELYSFDLVKKLAAANNIKLVSSRHWRAYEPPVSEESLIRLRSKVPEFVYPDNVFVRSTWNDFLDSTHMFVGSRNRFSQWFAKQLFETEVKE